MFGNYWPHEDEVLIRADEDRSRLFIWALHRLWLGLWLHERVFVASHGQLEARCVRLVLSNSAVVQ